MKESWPSEIMSQSSNLSVNMVKERLPKYCYLNISEDDEEAFSIRLNQLQNNVRDAVDDGHGGAVDTDSDTCSDGK